MKKRITAIAERIAGTPGWISKFLRDYDLSIETDELGGGEVFWIETSDDMTELSPKLESIEDLCDWIKRNKLKIHKALSYTNKSTKPLV